MKIIVLLLLGALATSCGGATELPTSATSNPGGLPFGPAQTYDMHPAPGVEPEPGAEPALEEPSDADWAELAAEFAAMAIDGFEEALAAVTADSARWPAGPRAFGTRLFTLPPRPRSTTYRVDYWCCGRTTGYYISQSGQLTFNTEFTSGIRLFHEILFRQPAPVPWRPSGSARSWDINIPTSGLRMQSTVAISNQQIQPAQTFQLTGTMTYERKSEGMPAPAPTPAPIPAPTPAPIPPPIPAPTPAPIPRPALKTAAVNVSLQYRDYQAKLPPTAVGHWGAVQLIGNSLPAVPAPTRAPSATLPPSPVPVPSPTPTPTPAPAPTPPAPEPPSAPISAFDGTYSATATGGRKDGDTLTFSVVTGVIPEFIIGGGLPFSGTVSASGAVAIRSLGQECARITLVGQITITDAGGATVAGTWVQENLMTHPNDRGCQNESGTWTGTRTTPAAPSTIGDRR